MTLFDSVPDIYNNTLDMVAFIVGDNYSSIQSTATKLHVQQVGRVRPQLKSVDAVEELIPTGASHRKLVVLLERMKKFQSVTKKPQCDGVDLVDVHLLFDALHAWSPEGVRKICALPGIRVCCCQGYQRRGSFQRGVDSSQAL
ncbi:hypothetical protein JG687_00010750 [Phytophthora cactorum]|uniref:Uncharacterized protein n=1 Tax=Phytophthora cactorum TaxID=29920 RepID=A0A8T1U876_9STRA|nr:hypothetical protein JG687_00010750 [Phytophthora cactorum]